MKTRKDKKTQQIVELAVDKVRQAVHEAHDKPSAAKNERSEFTPGPWKVSRAFQNNGPDYFVISTGKWKSPAIATCDNEADAKLIAAAPELLEALKEINEDLLSLSADELKPLGVRAALNRTFRAIAKAEGK